MSYGVTMLPIADGQSWEEVLAMEEEASDRGRSAFPVPDEVREQWQRIIDRVQSVLPESTAEAEHLELEIHDAATGISVSADKHSAGLRVPYWYRGAEADQVLALVADVVRIVCEETGFEAWDPQMGRPFFSRGDGIGADVMNEQRDLLDRIERGEL